MNTLIERSQVRCAIYARSPRHGAKDVSPQLAACFAAAAAKGWDVREADVYTDMNSRARRTIEKRPGLAKLLANVQSDACRFTLVLIDDPVRLSGKIAEMLEVYSLLSQAGMRVQIAEPLSAEDYHLQRPENDFSARKSDLS